jgi:ABC-2 type transport system permease protein
MADLSRTLGVGEQIKLIAGLRWRLRRNNLRKKNNRLDLIGLIVAGAFASLLVIGLSFAFFAGGYNFISSGRAAWLALLFWGIFVFWQLVPIFSVGFGSSFEFRNLLRFPLDLRTFYVIGLAYGFADFPAIASLCWLAALTAGVTTANSRLLPYLLVIVAFFIVLNVTLERLVGSWLERILARRKTRELFFALFILMMVSTQFIGPVINHYGNAARPSVTRLLRYLAPLPPSLTGRAAAGAAMGNIHDVLLGLGGTLVWALLFSGLLWMRFSSQYRGEELSESVAPVRAKVRTSDTQESQSDTLSLLSPQIAAVVRKEFRYLTRNGFAVLLLFLPPLFVFLFTLQGHGGHSAIQDKDMPTGAFFPGLMAYLVLMLMAPAYNSFAYEGRGIQTYFMAPLRFRDVFLGKNLMLLALIAFELALSISAYSYRVGLPPLPPFLATLAAIVFTVIGQLTIANWSSLSFPRKLVFGQMRGQRQSGMAALIAFGAQLILGAISLPIMLLSRWTGDRWLPAEIFAFLAVGAIAGYFASLDPLSHFAEKKKESLIEALCR